MGLPPVLVGAAQETVAEWLPATAVTPVGDPGTIALATGEGLEEGDGLGLEEGDGLGLEEGDGLGLDDDDAPKKSLIAEAPESLVVSAARLQSCSSVLSSE